MSIPPLQRMIFQLSEQKRQTAHSDRVGYVHEIKGSKMRVVMGIKHDGSPWLSPWLHTTNHRGGSKDHQQFSVGQNVRLAGAGGSMRQATITPYAPSESHPTPGQMPKEPSGDYVQTGDSLFETKTMGGSHNMWISNSPVTAPEHQEQSGQPEGGGGGNGGSSGGQSGGQSGSQSGGGSKPEAKMIVRIDPDGHITARFGNDDKAPRMAVHEKGAKIRHDQNWMFVDKDGVWVSAPPKIKKDPIPNDNKTD